MKTKYLMILTLISSVSFAKRNDIAKLEPIWTNENYPLISPQIKHNFDPEANINNANQCTRSPNNPDKNPSGNNKKQTLDYLEEDVVNLYNNLKNCTENAFIGLSQFWTEIGNACLDLGKVFNPNNQNSNDEIEMFKPFNNISCCFGHTINAVLILMFYTGLKGVALGTLYFCKDGICTLYHTECVIFQSLQKINNKFNVSGKIYSSITYVGNKILSCSKWCYGKLFSQHN